MDSDGAFASYGSNMRYLTNPLDGLEMSQNLSWTVEFRVLTSLMASKPLTLNGTIVIPTSWANLTISILDVKMGTTSMNCLCPFPPLKVTAPEKTCLDPQSWTSSVFPHRMECHSHWCNDLLRQRVDQYSPAKINLSFLAPQRKSISMAPAILLASVLVHSAGSGNTVSRHLYSSSHRHQKGDRSPSLVGSQADATAPIFPATEINSLPFAMSSPMAAGR